MLQANAAILSHSVHMGQILPLALLAHVTCEIKAETSEELLKLKSMFAIPKHGPLHNGRTICSAYHGCLQERYPISHSSCFDVWYRSFPVPPHRPWYVQPLNLLTVWKTRTFQLHCSLLEFVISSLQHEKSFTDRFASCQSRKCNVFSVLEFRGETLSLCPNTCKTKMVTLTLSVVAAP